MELDKSGWVISLTEHTLLTPNGWIAVGIICIGLLVGPDDEALQKKVLDTPSKVCYTGGMSSKDSYWFRNKYMR